MKMNRKHIAVNRGKTKHDDDYVDLPSYECLSFVWDLTEEVFSLSGEYDVKSRLQRNVVNIIRKQSTGNIQAKTDYK